MTEEMIAGQIIEYDKDNTPHFIIDGVDISDCGFLDNHRPTKLLLCNECTSDFEAMECKDYHDCYYKQMKRLEQKLEKIKGIAIKYSQREDYLLGGLYADLIDRLNEVLKDE